MNDADRTWEIFDFVSYLISFEATVFQHSSFENYSVTVDMRPKTSDEPSQNFLNCLINDTGTMNFKDILPESVISDSQYVFILAFPLPRTCLDPTPASSSPMRF